MLIFGERHLEHLVAEYVTHFHRERPHQGLGNALKNADHDRRADSVSRSLGWFAKILPSRCSIVVACQRQTRKIEYISASEARGEIYLVCSGFVVSQYELMR